MGGLAARAWRTATADATKLPKILRPCREKLYGLTIIEHNVEDSADNMTRFVILAQEALAPEALAGTAAGVFVGVAQHQVLDHELHVHQPDDPALILDQCDGTGIDHDLDTLTALLDSLAQPLATLEQELCDNLLQLACALARQVVRRELTAVPQRIGELVREGVAALPPAARQISVHLNPLDLDLVRGISPRGRSASSAKTLGAPSCSSVRILLGMVRNTAPAPRFWLKALTRKRARPWISNEKSHSSVSS